MNSFFHSGNVILHINVIMYSMLYLEFGGGKLSLHDGYCIEPFWCESLNLFGSTFGP